MRLLPAVKKKLISSPYITLHGEVALLTAIAIMMTRMVKVVEMAVAMEVECLCGVFVDKLPECLTCWPTLFPLI